MAITTQSPRLFYFLIFIVLFFSLSSIEIRSNDIRSDGRPIIRFDEFGFTHRGRLELNVSHIPFLSPSTDMDLSKIGFFLCTRDSWMHVLQQIDDGEIMCALQSQLIYSVYNFKDLNGADSFNAEFQIETADQYTLVFGNCLSQLKVSMNVRSAMYNLEEKTGRDYLSASKTVLPKVYFLFSLIYFTIVGLWVFVFYKKRLTIFGIHFFMPAVVVLKALNLICEAKDKSYIKRTGSAHGWDVLFYIFSFLKGITLFTLIVLIGTGWSCYD